MTFKRGKLGVKIVKAFISDGFLVPNLVHQGWAVHRERDLHFFTEEQFERLGVGGRGGVRVNWRGGVLWGLLEGWGGGGGVDAWLTRSLVLTAKHLQSLRVIRPDELLAWMRVENAPQI